MTDVITNPLSREERSAAVNALDALIDITSNETWRSQQRFDTDVRLAKEAVRRDTLTAAEISDTVNFVGLLADTLSRQPGSDTVVSLLRAITAQLSDAAARKETP
jgi:hypothetical protein